MANRRLLLLSLSLSAPVCPALASPEHETAPPPKATVDLAAYPRMGSRQDLGLSPRARPSIDDEQRPMGLPVATPSNLLEQMATSSSPCSITVAPTAEQVQARQVNNPAVSIIFLSSALASATSNMVAMSQQMSSSIIQLQSSLRSIASSASSAIISVQTSAAKELAAVESSASEAIASAEESAASRVSEIMALAGLPTASVSLPPQKNTYEVVRHDESSLSVAMVAVAIVASIVGSTFFSILGFYLFVFRRRNKQQKKHEETRKEDELDVNAALDRAIVSYIAKESPGLMSPGTQQRGQAMMMDDVAASGAPRSSFLTVPHAYRGHRPRPSLPTNSSPRMVSSPTMPGHTRHGSIPLILGEPSGFMSPPISAPPGPPPTYPLPEIPTTPKTPRTPRTPRLPRLPAKTFKRTSSNTGQDSSERIYTQILNKPLQPTPTASPTTPTPLLDEEDPMEGRPERKSKRNSNWPLSSSNAWV